jgi:hypothetical protein
MLAHEILKNHISREAAKPRRKTIKKTVLREAERIYHARRLLQGNRM